MEVASYTGAWIETFLRGLVIFVINVASYTGAWIETLKKEKNMFVQERRILYGCVD